MHLMLRLLRLMLRLLHLMQTVSACQAANSSHKEILKASKISQHISHTLITQGAPGTSLKQVYRFSKICNNLIGLSPFQIMQG